MNEALIAGPLGGLAVLIVKWLLDRRVSQATVEKTEAEAEKVTAEAGSIIQAGYEKYTAALELRLESLEVRVTTLEEALHASEAQVRGLTRLLRSTVRWALTLRDEVIRLGGAVPEMPSEVELALTTLDSSD